MTKPFPTHYADSPITLSGLHVEDPLMRERKFHSIVPRGSIAGNALVVVIAIMSLLASLTLGAVSLVNDTAGTWQNEIAREVTIQIRPIKGKDLDESVNLARQIAAGFAGIESVTVVDNEAMERLLGPWLGNGLDLDELPVPRLVTLVIDENNPPDLASLGAQISQNISGASLDDHRAWVDRLTTMAQATILIGLLIFLLMMAATILTVVFATRGAMSGNQHVIEVLHFVGAEQGYIAGEFQKHFLVLGLKGTLAGGISALLSFLCLGWWSGRNIADPTGDQVAALFGTFSVGPSGYIGTLALIFVISILTAMTSRYTVLKHVGTLDRNSRPD